MDLNLKSSVDKCVIDQNDTFSLEDVQGIVMDMRKTEDSSATKRKIVLASCVLLATVSVIDIALVRSNNRVTFLSTTNVEDSSARRLQLFDDNWISCDGLATVPSSYVNGGIDSSIIHICKPTLSSYNCGDGTVPTMSPTSAPAEVPPTPAEVSITPSDFPTEYLTQSPTEPPTIPPTSRPSDSCFNSLHLNWAADPKHSCEWLSRRADRARALCAKRREVRELCPVTCGTCCGDNPNFVTATAFAYGEGLGCDWFGEDDWRRDSFCSVREISEYCPKTCNSCPDYISMRPSYSGTTNITDAPTGRLDDD